MAAESDQANGAKQVEVPCSSKRYRRGRFLKQGYHKSERSDARREAARLFLSGITLDKNRSFNVLTPRSQLPTVALTQEEALSSAGNPLGGTMEGNTPLKPDQLQFQSTSNSPFFPESVAAIPLSGVQAQDRSIESPRLGKRRKSFKKKLSFEALSEAALPGTRSLIVLRDYSRDPANRRLVITYDDRPVVVSSILPYKKSSDKGLQSGRARTSSCSMPLELGEIDLESAQEISLANHGLLDPIWSKEESFQDQTSLAGGGVASPGCPVQRHSWHHTPAHDWLGQHHLLRDMLTPPPVETSSNVFPFLRFKDNHSPHYVIVNYHPDCLDNREYFMGRSMATFFLPGYHISIIKYSRASELKKEINRKMNEVFPHVRISLTKLRSLKQQMVEVGLENELDLAAIVHAHVYYEKLVMMGKVMKSNRKVLAGVCLLLAAKFSTDMKKTEISNLIEEITDKFKVSSKELLRYEMPVLVAMEFSLLTPLPQLLLHYDRICQLDSN